jgi:carboxymethylenebutenolidase
LPDMYYRMGTIRLETHRPNDAMASVWRACYLSTTNQMVIEDTAAMLAWLDAQDKVKPGKVGCFGYCMSGQFVVSVMARFPHRIGSAASLYGVKIITDQPDSPHKLLGHIKGELYFAFAEIDRSVPLPMVEELRGHLDQAGTKYEIEVFPGTHHGFGFPERAVYDTQAHEQSWAKMLSLWERTLK